MDLIHLEFLVQRLLYFLLKSESFEKENDIKKEIAESNGYLKTW